MSNVFKMKSFEESVDKDSILKNILKILDIDSRIIVAEKKDTNWWQKIITKDGLVHHFL